MHSAPTKSDVSDAVAAFIIAPQSGAEYDQALAKARAFLGAARSVAANTLVEKALAPNGDVLRMAASHAAAFAANADLADVAAVLGAALATGRLAGSSDEAIAAAVACGRELETRIRHSVGDRTFDAIWNANSAIGIFGAVAAAARLLKLDSAQARNALGLAATQSAGLAITTGVAGAVAVGKAAADAVEAAVLAGHGFTSSAASIEGRRGFAALMATEFHPEAIVDALGTHWSSRT
jgi:hypothetical protein